MKIGYGDRLRVPTHVRHSGQVWLDFNTGTDHAEVYMMSPKKARKLALRLLREAERIEGAKR